MFLRLYITYWKIENVNFKLFFLSLCKFSIHPLLPFPEELIICLQRANSYLKVKRMSFYTHPLTLIICLVVALSRYACINSLIVVFLHLRTHPLVLCS